MRAALVAPFVSSVVVDLADLTHADPHGTRHRMASQRLEGWQLHSGAEQSGPGRALIHEHEPVGATLVPRRLLSGDRTEDPSWPAEVTAAHVTTGVHGVGALVFWVDVADRAALRALEDALCPHIAPTATAVSAFLAEHLPAARARTAAGRYPEDEFLWWHRVLLPDPSEATSSLASLAGRLASFRSERLEVVVGDGASVVVTTDDTEAVRAVQGVVDAQEVWLTGETSSREVVAEIAELQSAPAQGHALHAASARAVAVAEAEQLRAALLQDQLRYTAGTRRAALDCAADAWGMSLSLEPVQQHVTTLQDMLLRRLEQQREEQAHRLSLWVLALTVVSALGLLLGLFETAVGPVPEHDGVRLGVAAVVGVLVLTALTTTTVALRRSR